MRIVLFLCLLFISSEVWAKNNKIEGGFWTRTSWIQLMYGIWVNFTTLSIGLAFGFPAVQVPQLSHPNSEVQITRGDASWIASIMTLFSPIGCLLSGYVIDRFGRRTMIIACQAPMCIGWFYTGMAPSAIHIIIGRSLTGIGCGMAMGPPRIFSTEIALPNMRGVVGTFPSVALALGICIQAGLGVLFHWQWLCYMCSVFAFVNLLLYNLLPETPYFLLTRAANMDQAKKNLARFRGPSYDLDAELAQLLEFKNDNKIRKLSFKENVERLFTRSSCKPFMVVNTYIIITQLSGVNAVLMWGVEILGEAKSSIDMETGYFMLTITRLVIVTASSVMLFRVGRRRLSLISACGVSIVCFSLGIFILYNTETSIIPQLSFMAYMFFASVGFYTIPFLLMAELYPLQVRGTLSGITVSASSIVVFCCVKLYPFIRDTIGLGNTIIVFGANALLGAIFIYYCLPETKDLTLQEIEEYYNELRPTLTSQRRLQTLQSQQTLSKTNQTSAPKVSPSLRILEPGNQSKLNMAKDVEPGKQSKSSVPKDAEPGKQSKSTTAKGAAPGKQSKLNILKDTDVAYREEAKRNVAEIKNLMNRPSLINFGDVPPERETSFRTLVREQMALQKKEGKKTDSKEKKKRTEQDIEEEKKRVRRRRSSSLRELRKKGAIKSADMEGSEESTDDEPSARRQDKNDGTQPSTSKQARA